MGIQQARRSRTWTGQIVTALPCLNPTTMSWNLKNGCAVQISGKQSADIVFRPRLFCLPSDTLDVSINLSFLPLRILTSSISYRSSAASGKNSRKPSNKSRLHNRKLSEPSLSSSEVSKNDRRPSFAQKEKQKQRPLFHPPSIPPEKVSSCYEGSKRQRILQEQWQRIET